MLTAVLLFKSYLARNLGGLDASGLAGIGVNLLIHLLAILFQMLKNLFKNLIATAD